MHLRPRNPKRDRLVNEPLAAYSYFQIGARPGAGGGARAPLQGCLPAVESLTGALPCSGSWCLHLILGLCHSLSPCLHTVVSMVPSVPSLSQASFSMTLSLGHCLLSFLGSLGVSLFLPLSVSSLLCPCRSLLESLSLCPSLCVCHCALVCLHATVLCSCLCVCVPDPVSLCLHLCLPVPPCLSPRCHPVICWLH